MGSDAASSPGTPGIGILRADAACRFETVLWWRGGGAPGAADLPGPPKLDLVPSEHFSLIFRTRTRTQGRMREGSRNDTGKISEALVLAAFAMDGIPVALPYGGHDRWDLVARIDGRWQAIQVKTARSNKTVGFSWSAKTNAESPSYAEGEIDWFVIVYPETGRMWRIPIADAANKTSHPLEDRYLWKPGTVTVCEAPHPQPSYVIPYSPYRQRKSYLRRIMDGHDVLSMECPPGISQDHWEAMRLHAQGMGLWKIARHFHRDASTVAEWIERGLLRLEWATLADLKRLAAA